MVRQGAQEGVLYPRKTAGSAVFLDPRGLLETSLHPHRDRSENPGGYVATRKMLHPNDASWKADRLVFRGVKTPEVAASRMDLAPSHEGENLVLKKMERGDFLKRADVREGSEVSLRVPCRSEGSLQRDRLEPSGA